MRTSTAAAGSSLFFALAPGVVAGVVPWWLTGWEPEPVWPALRGLGALLVVACGVVLVEAFARFVREGLGTPAPVAPTAHLVVGGLYRFVRNPMYVAVVGAVVGQALLLGRPSLLLYAAGLQVLFLWFVRTVEEPVLRARYGAEYDAYRASVPGWWPRAPRARRRRATS